MRLLVSLVLLLFVTTHALAADKGIALSQKGAASSSSGQRRLALVIGNSDYRHSGALANPVRDAQLIAKTLKDVGFDLHGGGAQTDLTRNSLDQMIESFGDAIRPGDVALFYYSGHGLQVAGENYLVPVDADIKKESEVRVKTVPVNLLFAKLDGIPKAVNIVVLDACRNNPFARSFRSSGGGLASVSAPTGTLVAFSTAPGQVAEDGSGSNSAYTAALAKYLKEPGLMVEQVFKKVRSEVSSATKGQQTPWENTSLTGNFKFIDGDALALKKEQLKAAGAAKSAELERLLKMEAEAKAAKEREQAEIAARQAEVAKMDAEIAAMKTRLGAGTATGNDSLDNMLAMVEQRETQAQKLEALRRQRAEEERKREAEIARLKAEEGEKRRKSVEAEIAKYEKIVNSPYGKDMADAAWQSLVAKYVGAEELDRGDLTMFRLVAIDGLTVDEIRRGRQAFEDIIKEYEEEYASFVGELVAVPGGCFQMGDQFGDDNFNEEPVHEVCVDSFSLGKFEVTQGQWRKVMGNNPANFQNGDKYPVEKVSWHDVQEFIRKLNQKTGQTFRLPTEAEWEYACRSGGKKEKYCGGDNLDAFAWYDSNSDGKTHPVGQKKPNGLGLYDMSGNVSEWCKDFYDAKYYKKSPRQNPHGPSVSTNNRVPRGGSWWGPPWLQRSTKRIGVSPDIRTENLGFRLLTQD